MNHKRITYLQRIYGYTEAQKSINSGLVWKMEGSAGRFAMSLLEAGICMLPKVPRMDYYGSMVPSRYNVEPGTTGSYGNARDFWSAVDDGEPWALEAVGALEYDDDPDLYI